MLVIVVHHCRKIILINFYDGLYDLNFQWREKGVDGIFFGTNCAYVSAHSYVVILVVVRSWHSYFVARLSDIVGEVNSL